MIIKFLRDHLSSVAGDVIEVDDRRGIAFVRSGIAELTSVVPAPEIVEPPEELPVTEERYEL